MLKKAKWTVQQEEKLVESWREKKNAYMILYEA